MRQGEKAKIRIKKKYGFGRPGEVEKLIFPPGFAEAGEKRDKITNKAVIYEVELLLFVKREDLEHNGSIFKQITCPSADKYEHEKPSCEWDEVTAEVAFCQERGDIFEPFNGEWMHKLDLVGPVKSIESPLVKRLIESMKRGEQAEFTVVASQFNNKNEEDSFTDTVITEKIPGYNPEKDLYVTVKLNSLIKVEDWYKDGRTLVKTLRKGGKGRSPYADSTIQFRMRVLVNGTQIFSNFPVDFIQDSDDLRKMSPEERQNFLSSESLITTRIDEYNLPSLLIKFIKSLKKNSHAELTTTDIARLHKNFPSQYFDQYKAFKDGDTVVFVVSLYSIKNTSYFYKLPVAQKIDYVNRLKTKAGDFFKAGNLQKAAKIY